MQPDIGPETLSVAPRIELSSPADLRLPLTWIAILHGRVDASLAVSGGVDTAADVARFLLAGADVVMTTSALLRHGTRHATALRDGLVTWMRAKGFTSLDDVRGLMSVAREADPELRQRAGYVGMLEAAGQTYGSVSW